jgi:ribosomal protein S27AE
MNSDKAAAVRDSVNACPDIVEVADTGEYSRTLEDRQHGGVEVTFTGEHLTPSDTSFRPAYVEQSGTVSDGNGAKRPVHVVVLEALWLNHSDVRSLSPELVYEVAKHDCRIRFYPPDHRLDGDIWIVDHFTEDLSNSDGDRCPECGSTYFKLRDGELECAKCGITEESVQTELGKVVTDGGYSPELGGEQ